MVACILIGRGKKVMSEKSFEDIYAEHMEMISKAIENLAERQKGIEEAFGHIPKPGADMIKYKPPEYEDYLNLTQIFDDLYTRLNMLEGRIKELEK